MTHQLLPRHGHAPDADDCHALALYWDNEAMRPDANDQSVLVCLAEAKHWRDVANVIERLTQATPRPAAAEPGALADRAEARSRRKRPGFFS